MLTPDANKKSEEEKNKNPPGAGLHSCHPGTHSMGGSAVQIGNLADV